MLDLPPLAWLILGMSAFLVGISKTAIPGISTVSVALCASALPAKASTGFLLVLLLIGDAFALTMYRKHAHWPTLFRMVPTVLMGLVAGAFFLYLSSDTEVRRGIALILLVLLAVTLWQRRHQPQQPPAEGAGTSRTKTMTYGIAAGFTTMVANAGGPITSLYFLAVRFDIKAFLGTAAWFFATVNIIKLPFSLTMGLVNTGTLTLSLCLAPLVVIGAFTGKAIAQRISQQLFDNLVITMTLIGALYLLT